MTDDPAYNCRELMIMRWLAALCIVLALESGVDALSKARFCPEAAIQSEGHFES